MTSVEVGMKMHERDRNRATHLFRTQSVGKNSLDLEPNACLGSFEPDWSKFENVFASDLLPYAASRNVDKNHRKSSEAKSRFDLMPYAPARQVQTSQFLLEVVDILLDYIRKTNDRTTKVLDFHHPSTLREMMGHCIDLPTEPQNLEQVLSDCKETLKYCVKTGHPRFFNQLSTGLDMIALAGEWLTATANTNMFTYEIAPVFTLMEDIVLTKMRELVGWSTGDGIFAPGGAISNMYAVAVAREKFMPEIKQKGMTGMPRLVMFTSEHAHFSIKRSGVLLGIGLENVILIGTDERGLMRPDELDEKLTAARRAGGQPFFVSCTVGTTVFGAFDPVDAIADVCEKHGVWLHVDGAWGGSALLSSRTRGLLSGVHRADSLTWNPHKLMGALLQCSAILLKEKGLLEACNSLRASYLFQQDKHYDIAYDTGDKAIQCGRHNDIFKLWLLWRAKGDIGFEQHIDKLLDLSRYLQTKIAGREGFEYVLENPQFINTCFWYVPRSMRQMPRGKERDDLLHKVAPRIKARMMESGNTMVGYQPIDNKPNFFRMVISNPGVIESDIDFLISEIERLGEEE